MKNYSKIILTSPKILFLLLLIAPVHAHAQDAEEAGDFLIGHEPEHVDTVRRARLEPLPPRALTADASPHPLPSRRQGGGAQKVLDKEATRGEEGEL